MRVLSGSARGRPLKGPPSRGTRPMAGKIKIALFNALTSLGITPERVLDLYAGTGGIGIEALSRGAEWVDFVEQNATAAKVIRENLASTGFAGNAQVHHMSVNAFLLHRATQPYDFIVLDPPYADPEIIPTLKRVGNGELVQSDTVVAIGHSPRVTLPDTLGRLTCLRHRCHGDSCFSIYEVDDDRTREAGGAGEDEPVG